MNYPIYNKTDLKMAPKDGAYEYIEFHDFISDLVNMELLEHSAEIGIAKYILDNGTKNLSDKQSVILQKILKRYTDLDCSRCGLKIPLSEVISSLDNGDLCGYCYHQLQK